MALEPHSIPSELLSSVSRSFYLTLRVLPAAVRPQIGLAYLLARTTDTIADTELVAVERRLQALQALRQRILGRSRARLELGELTDKQGSESERRLLEQCETSLALLDQLSPSDRNLTSAVLDTITSGQELDLERFNGASADHVIALKSDAELEDYTFRVAGCVGEFWTKVCRAHLYARANLDDTALVADGVRFGKGLQLVNILRDLPRDLSAGRCYLPGERLESAGLKAGDLLNPASESRVRPLYNSLLDQAEGYLRSGWKYTLSLPGRPIRLKLACAWPVLIGLETIRLLRSNPILGDRAPVKISRAKVRRIMVRSVLFYPIPLAWRKLGEAWISPASALQGHRDERE
jgi:farnesyl-diphosphate farnesyltransferase